MKKEELLEAVIRLDKIASTVKMSRQEHLMISLDIKKLREFIEEKTKPVVRKPKKIKEN